MLQDERENVSAKNTFVKEFETAYQRASVIVDYIYYIINTIHINHYLDI